MKIEYVDVNDIRPYENNAKLHPEWQIEQIKKSIQEFGFNDPIAIWKDGAIIEGHGRLLAAQELKMQTVPVIRLDKLTDEQRKAYTLVHNKLTTNTGFDVGILQQELDEILNIDMSLYGFQDIEIESFFDEEMISEATAEDSSKKYKVLCICSEESEYAELIEYLDEKEIKYEER